MLSAAASLAFGAFSAPAAPLPRLRVSENGRCFVKADGSPFFYMGDTEWGLFRLNREDAELYLKDRAAKKFNVIQAVATFWGLDRPNPYGETVFVNGDPTHPNEASFKHVDWVVDKAESLGLYIGMVPIWSKGYVSQDLKFLQNPSFGPTIREAVRPDKPSVLDKTSAFSYDKFLGSRYRDKPIIWILGGDWFATGVEDIWRAMAAGIAEGDGGAHLKTHHPKSPRSSSQWFHTDAWQAGKPLRGPRESGCWEYLLHAHNLGIVQLDTESRPIRQLNLAVPIVPNWILLEILSAHIHGVPVFNYRAHRRRLACHEVRQCI